LTLVVIFCPTVWAGCAFSGPSPARARSSPAKNSCPATGTPWSGYGASTLGSQPLTNLLLLAAGGMSLFDSLCHAFGTVSTSGYSPKNLSIGHYNNAYFDWVIIVFMFLGGMTFMLFFRMMRGDWHSGESIPNSAGMWVCWCSSAGGGLDSVEGTAPTTRLAESCAMPPSR
jgi:hypothetical protein